MTRPTGTRDQTELDLAARVLDLVRRHAGADAEAEVLVARREYALTRFAVSFIHQNVADESTSVRLRLHRNGRTAGGSTTVVDAAGLEGLVTRTLEAARLLPPDPGWPGLAPSAPAPGTALDDATAGTGPEERAERVRAFVDAAGGLETAGYCSTSSTRAAFANSAGQSLAGAYTEAGMDGIARAGGAPGARPRTASRGWRPAGWPTSTGACSAHAPRRRRVPPWTPSRCRPAATRSCWSRPPSGTCC